MELKFYKRQIAAKFYIKPLLPIIVCLMTVYTSCRKAENVPAPSTSTQSASNDAVSGQIAVNIAKSLSGTYGGVNINDGVDSISLSNHNGPQHGYNASALCGFYSDSLVNYTCKSGDTTTHTGGNLKFYFNCKDGKSTGYTAYDSLVTVKTTPKVVYNYFVKQYYTIKCLDDKHTFTGVDGEIDFTNSVICSDKSIVANIGSASYILKDLTIDLCHNDILSGTATFQAYGTNNNQNWSLSGSVTFLGNHMADVLINNKVYHVNVLTGKIVG